MEIEHKNMTQLKQYAAWEKENFPDGCERLHVLDWAVSEIERLRTYSNNLGLVNIQLDHKTTLLASCEIALKERDENICEMNAVLQAVKDWDIEKTIEDNGGFRFAIPEELREKMQVLLDT